MDIRSTADDFKVMMGLEDFMALLEIHDVRYLSMNPSTLELRTF